MKNHVIRNIEIISALLIGILPLGLIIGTGVSEGIIILTNIFFLIIFFYKKKNQYFKKREIFYLLVIWIYLLINCLTANNPELSFNRSFFFFRYILLILIISHLFTNIYYQKIIFIIWSIIICITTIDIYFEFFYGKNTLGFISPDKARVVSFFYDELRAGGFVLGFFLFVINFWNSLLIKKKNSLQMINICNFVGILIFFGILLTGERANSLKALICITLMTFFLKLKIKKILIFLIFVLPMLLFIFSKELRTKAQLTYVNLSNIYNSLHLAHYDTALQIFKKYPLLGVGNKNFRLECKEEIYSNDKLKKNAERCSSHPHQIYFEILSELGLTGFFLIFTFIFLNIYQAIKIFLKKNNLILLSSIIYLVTSLIPLIPSGSFFSSFNGTLFWINFSIMLSFIINRKNYV